MLPVKDYFPFFFFFLNINFKFQIIITAIINNIFWRINNKINYMENVLLHQYGWWEAPQLISTMTVTANIYWAGTMHWTFAVSSLKLLPYFHQSDKPIVWIPWWPSWKKSQMGWKLSWKMLQLQVRIYWIWDSGVLSRELEIQFGCLGDSMLG